MYIQTDLVTDSLINFYLPICSFCQFVCVQKEESLHFHFASSQILKNLHLHHEQSQTEHYALNWPK